jgi:hypothetical protein
MNRILMDGLLATGLAFWLVASCARKPDAEEATPKQHATAPTERGPRGESLVHLDRAAQERLGLAVADLAPRSVRPQVEASGAVISDPGQVFELRAPVAGIVRPAKDWLGLGTTVVAPLILGWIEPRLTPVERGDLGTRGAQAQRDTLAARASLTAAQAELERVKRLNADGKNASDRAVEEAEARARVAEANLQGAKLEGSAIEAARGAGESTQAYPLFFQQGGEVVEISAHPGESLYSSQ